MRFKRSYPFRFASHPRFSRWQKSCRWVSRTYGQTDVQRITIRRSSSLGEGIEHEGCLDPIKVWKDHGNTILDGHNRYRICHDLGEQFQVVDNDLEDRCQAINWIINNQIGRRNATEEQKAHLRGKRYHEEKKAHGGSRSKARTLSGDLKAGERLADEFGVGQATNFEFPRIVGARKTPVVPLRYCDPQR